MFTFFTYSACFKVWKYPWKRPVKERYLIKIILYQQLQKECYFFSTKSVNVSLLWRPAGNILSILSEGMERWVQRLMICIFILSQDFVDRQNPIITVDPLTSLFKGVVQVEDWEHSKTCHCTLDETQPIHSQTSIEDFEIS